MLIDYHRKMLADRVRNEALYRALQQAIRPGHSVVADVGSGTGILAFMALKLGAKAVYLYEYGDVSKLSEKLARHNKIKGCHFIREHSAKVANPRPVDIIVSETLGNYAYEENILETLEDARRFLKPGGVIIPQRILQYAMPVSSERLYRELRSWDEVGYGLDFAPAREMSLDNLYVQSLAPADFPAGADSARRWDSADLRKPGNHSQRRGKAGWQVAAGFTLYGFALWWECELAEGVNLSTSPFAPRTHWEQLYLPIREPVAVEQNATLTLELFSDTRYEIGVNLRWKVIIRQPGGQAITQESDMRDGYLG